ncbi:ATPase AAA, partial [Ectothiorhodospira haloalkaliphila]
HTAHYVRLTRLLRELSIAKGDGQYAKLLANLAKVDVLILDDWGLMKLNAENRRDLLEVLEDRHGRRSTIATSQLPMDQWHDVIGDATLADAILDRLVHNAYKINLRGESMRKTQSKLTDTATSE